MSGHREWLLERYGPICAYCGRDFAAEVMTLDHVRPRKGKTAYDRPDNLVFACRECNASKADTPLMAFLLARRSRAVYLLEYGEHLSLPLQELAQQVAHRPLLGE